MKSFPAVVVVIVELVAFIFIVITIVNVLGVDGPEQQTVLPSSYLGRQKLLPVFIFPLVAQKPPVAFSDARWFAFFIDLYSGCHEMFTPVNKRVTPPTCY